MNMNLENFVFNVNTVLFAVFMIFATILYALIFYKHHKRNKLNYVEISEIYIKYITLLIISMLVLIIAFDLFLTGLKAIEYRRERYLNFFASVLIIGIDIWNFIRFIKLNLRDIEVSEKEEKNKKTIKIGEVLQIVFFTIIIFMPLWRIPEYLKLVENMKEMFIQIGISFFYSFIGIFLILKLNPLDLKSKLK